MALQVLEVNTLTVSERVNALNERYAVIQQTWKSVFVEGVHYGAAYKGSDKPTLKKPGAEGFCALFNIYPIFSAASIVEDFTNGVFHYRYVCELREIGTDKIVGTGIGSCNSKEDKYGYRWVKRHEVPSNLNINDLASKPNEAFEFDFAIEKAETTGKYGKPQEYWDRFNAAIEDGTATRATRKTKSGDRSGYIIDDTLYRVPNRDIFTLVNTLDKMAQKRALVAATLVATGASAFFTQDVEDFPDYGDMVVEGTVVEPETKTTPEPPAQPKGDIKHENGRKTYPTPPPPEKTINNGKELADELAADDATEVETIGKGKAAYLRQQIRKLDDGQDYEAKLLDRHSVKTLELIPIAAYDAECEAVKKAVEGTPDLTDHIEALKKDVMEYIDAFNINKVHESPPFQEENKEAYNELLATEAVSLMEAWGHLVIADWSQLTINSVTQRLLKARKAAQRK